MISGATRWLQKYYPVPAGEVSKSDAITHSLQKWRGLRREVLQEHKLKIVDECFVVNTARKVVLEVGSSSCALCLHWITKTNCPKCPLSRALGRRPCDNGKMSPYTIFLRTKDPEPMIAALEKAQAEAG